MNERQALLKSIAAVASDYRAEDGETPTLESVERWINQFDVPVQLPILREMNHALKKTYFSRKNVNTFLNGLLTTEKLVGADPCVFWKNVRFLDIQGGGNSQREMLALFDKLLNKQCGFGIAECGTNPTAYFYLDDAIFTGNRVRGDLENWIQSDAPKDAKLHVATIAQHSGGQYYAQGRIATAMKAAKKDIKISWWRSIELEDRRHFTNTSDVLRPTVIPDDPLVQEYVDAMGHKPHLRTGENVGGQAIFSSDAGRQVLEQEFLKAGVKIRKQSPQLGDTQRPLGHMTLETLGFGSLIVTFRNCPNNAPLALWAGNPWVPLFPRRTNSETSLRRFMEMLAKEDK
jgi:hypothetical protein